MDDTDKIPGSFGRLAPEVEATVVSEDGKELGPGEIGELIIRGSLLTKRYYRNPEATKLYRNPSYVSYRSAIHEGWFYTGDLVTYTKDRLFSFVDRKKELLKYDGNHISPGLKLHIPTNRSGIGNDFELTSGYSRSSSGWNSSTRSSRKRYAARLCRPSF